MLKTLRVFVILMLEYWNLSCHKPLLVQQLVKLIIKLSDKGLPINNHVLLDRCPCTTDCQVSFTVEKLRIFLKDAAIYVFFPTP